MLRSAIDRAGENGVELATGSTVVEPINLSNYRNLPFQRDSRPDAERIVFLVKVSLAGGWTRRRLWRGSKPMSARFDLSDAH